MILILVYAFIEKIADNYLFALDSKTPGSQCLLSPKHLKPLEKRKKHNYFLSKHPAFMAPRPKKTGIEPKIKI